MPNNIIITPGSASIQFSGSAANTIRLQVEDSGSIAFYGNSGSLFSITDQLSGSLMSVNDVSGLPILEVFSDDRVIMGTLNQNTLVVTGSRVGIRKNIPTADLDVSGSVVITGSLSTDRYNLSITALGNASGSMSINLGTANYFTATSTNTTNWSIINTPSNRAVGFILAIVSGGAVANTWPASVQWPNGSPPVLTPSGGLDVLTFITDNSGTNWRGVLSIINSK
jgi:hypothetical protein